MMKSKENLLGKIQSANGSLFSKAALSKTVRDA